MAIYEIVSDVLYVVGIAVVIYNLIHLNRNIDRYNNEVFPTLMRRCEEVELEMERISDASYQRMWHKAEALRGDIMKLQKEVDILMKWIEQHELRNPRL